VSTGGFVGGDVIREGSMLPDEAFMVLFFFLIFLKISNLYSGARMQSALYLSTCCKGHSHECPTVEVKFAQK
jgi:hypothetical protein